jgi:tripartite ATP-independent transporter DctP family solute receptor
MAGCRIDAILVRISDIYMRIELALLRAYLLILREYLTMKMIRVAGAALAMASLAFMPAQAQDVTLRIESSLPAGHATSKSMEIFKDEVARLSEGALEVEVTPGSQRTFKELMDGVHVGRLFAIWGSIGNFSKLVPEIAAVSLPFSFDNYDRARRAIAGPVGNLITAKLEAKGFIVLAWMELGAVQIANAKRPLKTLDDFKGLNIRVLPNATHLAAFQALGARPMVIPLTDLDKALRQGDVDGIELDYMTMFANKYYETQKYLSQTGHFLDFNVLVADRNAFASLDPAQQKAIREAAAITTVRQHEISAEDQATALSRLRDAGVQVDPLPSQTRAALRRAMSGVVDDVKKWVGADIVNKVLAANAPAGKVVAADKSRAGKTAAGSHISGAGRGAVGLVPATADGKVRSWK